MTQCDEELLTVRILVDGAEVLIDASFHVVSLGVIVGVNSPLRRHYDIHHIHAALLSEALLKRERQ